MDLKRKLIEVCHRIYEKGFVSAYDGNVSARISKNKFLITRSGVCKGEVTEKDICEIDSNGKILNGKGKISTEYKLHLFSYLKRKEINAVVHAHPVYTTAFSVLGEDLTKNIFPEVILTLGKVPLCKYATPSTDELPKSMEPFIDFSWAFILQNHGAVTLGKDLDDAYFKMEKLEHTAKTIVIARNLGSEKEIPKKKIKELIDISEKTYGIKLDERNIF